METDGPPTFRWRESLPELTLLLVVVRCERSAGGDVVRDGLASGMLMYCADDDADTVGANVSMARLTAPDRSAARSTAAGGCCGTRTGRNRPVVPAAMHSAADETRCDRTEHVGQRQPDWSPATMPRWNLLGSLAERAHDARRMQMVAGTPSICDRVDRRMIASAGR